MDKDLTCILYICDSQDEKVLNLFSKSEGFNLFLCTNRANVCKTAQLNPPDLVVIDLPGQSEDIITEQIKDLLDLSLNFKPAFFMVTSNLLEAEHRITLMKNGVDEFVLFPILPEEIKKKYEVYKTVKDCRQKIIAQEKTLNKTHEYLDKFKTQLKETKETLFDERASLNNALKQISQMTQERNRIQKEKKELKDRLVNNIDGWSGILSRLIENRVEKNRGHSERVSHIAQFIAKQLKFDEKKLEDLRKAAMLHETGLLLIPEATLKKETDQLSSYENDLLSQYPVKGADLFSDCDEFAGCAEIIRYLNENADGTGSPEGFKRRHIPLLSRILAGADVFDTLKDDVSVHDLESFLEKLEGFSGTRLDPNIVAWLEKYAVLHMGSDAYKVKGVGIHQLEPGMILGTAIFTNTGTKLFSVNTLLTQDAIDKIQNYNREYPVDETVYIRA